MKRLLIPAALILGLGAGAAVGATGFPRTKTTIRTYSTPVRVVTSAKQTTRLKHLEAELKTAKTYLATDRTRAVELQNASEAKNPTTARVAVAKAGLYPHCTYGSQPPIYTQTNPGMHEKPEVVQAGRCLQHNGTPETPAKEAEEETGETIGPESSQEKTENTARHVAECERSDVTDLGC